MKLKILIVNLCLIFCNDMAVADQARLLLSDQEALQARVDIIQQAKSEILVEYFSVWNDAQSVGGIALLVEAAQRGVKVKIIVDALSSRIPEPLLAALESKSIGPDGKQNLELRFYNPVMFDITKISHRDHSKMIIVDGKLLLTGGRNVGDKYFGVNGKRNFDDLDILLKGDVALVARDNYMKVWNAKIVRPPGPTSQFRKQLHPLACMAEEEYDSCAIRQRYALSLVKKEEDRMQAMLDEMVKEEPDDLVRANTNFDWMKNAEEIGRVRFMSHKPDELVRRETAYLSQDLLEALLKTKKDVNIVSPYLIPTDEVYFAFKALIARGVRIRVVTNSLASTDNVLAQAGYKYRKDELVRLGVEIWEYEGPNTLHAKTALLDHNEIYVGTYNIDPRSSFINREVAVSMVDKSGQGLSRELAQIIEEFRKKSKLVAKDGVEYNLEWQENNVSPAKRSLMNSLLPTMPAIIHQL